MFPATNGQNVFEVCIPWPEVLYDIVLIGLNAVAILFDIKPVFVSCCLELFCVLFCTCFTHKEKHSHGLDVHVQYHVVSNVFCSFSLSVVKISRSLYALSFYC